MNFRRKPGQIDSCHPIPSLATDIFWIGSFLVCGVAIYKDDLLNTCVWGASYFILTPIRTIWRYRSIPEKPRKD